MLTEAAEPFGARRADVGLLVIFRALRYVFAWLDVGPRFGTPRHAIRTLLFDVSPLEPAVYVGVGVTLLAASLSAAIGLGESIRSQRGARSNSSNGA